MKGSKREHKGVVSEPNLDMIRMERGLKGLLALNSALSKLYEATKWAIEVMMEKL